MHQYLKEIFGPHKEDLSADAVEHERQVTEAAIRDFQKMEDLHQRMGSQARCPGVHMTRASFWVVCYPPKFFLRKGYLLQGITLDGWGWYTWSHITLQAQQLDEQPFSEIAGEWSPTPLPWLMHVKDADRCPVRGIFVNGLPSLPSYQDLEAHLLKSS